MILGATLRLKDNFTSVMQKANQVTKKQAEAMKTAQTMTGEMQKSTSALNAQMRIHKSELKESLARLNANKNSVEALKLKQESYTKQLKTQTQIVEQLTQRHKKLVEAHGENSAKAMRAAASVAKAKAEQAKLERQIEETTNAIKNQSTALGRLKNDFQKAKADAMPTNRFEAMRGAGMAITGAGAVGAAALGGTVKIAADFESAMSRVAALSGATDRELQQLTETARNLGATTSFSASQAAEGMQFLSMAGFKTNEIIAAMPGMLDMAAAAQIDLGSAADIASNILSAFGLEAGEMGRVADVLTKAFTSANVDLKMLGYTMKYVGPIANATGLSLEEMTAAAGLLGNAGIQADQAGTTLRATILRLAKPPKEAATALEQLGVNVTDANGKMLPLADILEQVQTGMKGMTDAQKTAIAASIAGTEAASGFLALLDAGPEALRQFTGELQNAGGTAKEIAEKQLDNLNGSLTMLKSASEGAAITIGGTLSPYIRQAAGFLNSLVDKFNNLSPEMQKSIAITAAVATGFALVGGPMLLLIGFLPMIANGLSMVGGAFKLLGTAALNPITLALAALVVAGVLLYKNWDTIKERANKLKSDIIGLKNSAVDYLKDAIEKVKDKYEEWQPVIKRTATILGVIFGPALIKTGIHATTAGAKIAATFILNVARAGTQALVSATLITANFVASLIKSGAQAVVAGGKIVISFVGSLIKTAAQATITAAIITGQLLMATLRYAASGWAVVASVTAQTTAWLIQKGAMVAGAAVTGAMTAAQWALNAAMMAAPYMWIIAAIAGVVAAGVMLYKNWDTVKAKASAIWGSIKQTLADFVSSAIEKFNEFKDRIENIWNDVKTFLKNPIKGTVNLIQNAIGGNSGNAKSHAMGLAYVPYDNYPALLHKGETVLTRAEADQYRKGSNTNNNNVFNININGYNRSTDEILDELEDRLLRVAANMGGA